MGKYCWEWDVGCQKWNQVAGCTTCLQPKMTPENFRKLAARRPLNPLPEPARALSDEWAKFRKTTALRCLCIALKQRAILQLKAACLSLAGSNIQACCGVWVGSGNGAIGLENYTHACSARVYVRLKPMGKCPGNLMILADPGFIRKPSAGGLPRRNSGLRVSWTPGTSFLSQSVLWLCGA